MALHRDIFWIGRQWAVTGFGMQAINQKHEGQFDIPIERLWDEDLPNGAREQKWFNPDDFNKGLGIARARHPKPPQSAKPQSAKPPSPAPVETTHASIATTASEPLPLPIVSAVVEPAIVTTATVPESATPSNPAPPFHEMGVLGHPAKLSRVWHARRRK